MIPFAGQLLKPLLPVPVHRTRPKCPLCSDYSKPVCGRGWLTHRCVLPRGHAGAHHSCDDEMCELQVWTDAEYCHDPHCWQSMEGDESTGEISADSGLRCDDCKMMFCPEHLSINGAQFRQCRSCFVDARQRRTGDYHGNE